MAKRRKGKRPVRKGKAPLPKRKAPSAAKKTKTVKYTFLTKKGIPRKDERGRFVSKEDWALRSKEILRRLRSDVERERELARQKQTRQKEVERLRKARSKRVRTKTGRVKAAFKAETLPQQAKREFELQRDAALVDLGQLPTPHETSRIGQHQILLWRWFGPEAVDLAGDFIRELRNHFPPETLGRVAIGTNYGKDGRWVGTRTLPIDDTTQHGRDDMWWSLQRLTATVSGKVVMGDVDEGMNDVWVEVELIVPLKWKP